MSALWGWSPQAQSRLKRSLVIPRSCDPPLLALLGCQAALGARRRQNLFVLGVMHLTKEVVPYMCAQRLASRSYGSMAIMVTARIYSII